MSFHGVTPHFWPVVYKYCVYQMLQDASSLCRDGRSQTREKGRDHNSVQHCCAVWLMWNNQRTINRNESAPCRCTGLCEPVLMSVAPVIITTDPRLHNISSKLTSSSYSLRSHQHHTVTWEGLILLCCSPTEVTRVMECSTSGTTSNIRGLVTSGEGGGGVKQSYPLWFWWCADGLMDLCCWLSSQGCVPSWRAPGSLTTWSGPSITPTRPSTPSK